MDPAYRTLTRICNKADQNSRNKLENVEKIDIFFESDFKKREILEKSSRETDLLLLDICRNNKKAINELLCLRCKISDLIYRSVKQLVRKGRKDNLKDVINIVLEDDGDKNLKLSNNKLKKMPFNYGTMERLEKHFSSLNEYIHPFCAEIMMTYEASRGAELSTWIYMKIQSHKEIKKIKLEDGEIYLSPYALLGNSTISTILKAWKTHGNLKEFKSIFAEDIIRNKKIDLTYDKNELIEKLINSYQLNYAKAKKKYRKAFNRNRGWEPDAEYLKNLNPPLKSSNLLRSIAEAVKKSKKREFELVKNKFSNKDSDKSEIDNSIDQIPQPEKNESSDFGEFLWFIFEKEILKLTEANFEKEYKSFIKHPDRKEAWLLYTKREIDDLDLISEICGHTQSWLNKRFKFKSIVNDATRNLLLEIKEIIDFKGIDIEKKIEEYNEINVNNKSYRKLTKDLYGLIDREFSSMKNSPDYINTISKRINRFYNPKKSPKKQEQEIKALESQGKETFEKLDHPSFFRDIMKDLIKKKVDLK